MTFLPPPLPPAGQSGAAESGRTPVQPPPLPASFREPPSRPPVSAPEFGRGFWLGVAGVVIVTIVAVVLIARFAFPPGREVDVLARRLMALSDQGRYQEGLALADKELPRITPNAAIYFAMENLHFGLDHLEETKAFAEKAIALDPKNETAIRLLVVICRDFEQYEQALTYGRAWIANNPDGADIYRLLAMNAHDAGHLDDAFTFAQEGHRRDPANARIASVYFYYAAAHLGTESTLRDIDTWLAKYRANEYFYAQIGKGLSEAGAWQEAQHYLQLAIDNGSDDESVPSEMLDCFKGLDDRAGAIAFAEDYASKHKPAAVFWRTLGSIHYDAEAYDEALTCFRQAQTLDAGSPVTMGNIIFALWELDRAREGITEGNAWLARHPGPRTAALHRAMGHACFNQSHYADAAVHYRAALAIDSSGIANARDLMSTLLELDRPEEALQFGTDWQDAHPDRHDDSFDAMLQRAREASTANDDDSAPEQVINEDRTPTP